MVRLTVIHRTVVSGVIGATLATAPSGTAVAKATTPTTQVNCSSNLVSNPDPGYSYFRSSAHLSVHSGPYGNCPVVDHGETKHKFWFW